MGGPAGGMNATVKELSTQLQRLEQRRSQYASIAASPQAAIMAYATLPRRLSRSLSPQPGQVRLDGRPASRDSSVRRARRAANGPAPPNNSYATPPGGGAAGA